MSKSYSLYPDDYIRELESDQRWLRALEDAGVDNWSGISFAYELMEEYAKDEED